MTYLHILFFWRTWCSGTPQTLIFIFKTIHRIQKILSHSVFSLKFYPNLIHVLFASPIFFWRTQYWHSPDAVFSKNANKEKNFTSTFASPCWRPMLLPKVNFACLGRWKKSSAGLRHILPLSGLKPQREERGGGGGDLDLPPVLILAPPPPSLFAVGDAWCSTGIRGKPDDNV